MTTANKTDNARAKASQRAIHEMSPPQDFLQYVKDYAREKPDVAAFWCLGIGFILGWKMKPW
jgi:hypothetical protein